MRRSRRAVAAAVAALALLAGMIALSPDPGPTPAVRNPTELLEDASFELATVRGGAWTGVADRARLPLGERRAYEGRRYALLRPAAAGRLIRQDVALGARNDRSYRATARVRAEGSTPVAGVLTAATNCAEPERADTRFTARPGTWALVSATLSPRHGEQCSLRWEIALDPAATGAVAVDVPSLTDAGLVDASFETTPVAGWRVNNLPGSTSLTVARVPDAVDGAAVGRVRATKRQGSIAQDVVLDASSEQLVATASLSVRRAPGTGASARPVGATVSLWLLCPGAAPQNRAVSAEVGTVWRRVEARLRTPGTLIRPGGDPCTLRVEVYVDDDAATVDLDAAELALRSAKPAKS